MQTQLLYELRGVIGGGLQRQDDVAQVGAALSALEAYVCQQAECCGQLGGAVLEVGSSAADRQDGLAQLGDVGVGFAGGHGQLVAEVVYIVLVGLDVQGGHRVRDEVRSIGEVHAACGSQIQHRGQHLGGFVGIVTGKGQIIQASAACVAENFVELPISLATRVRLSISSVLLPMVAAT